MKLHLVLLLLGVANAQLHFAFYQNKLYYNIETSFAQRAIQTLMGLVNLKSHQIIPDASGTIFGSIVGDGDGPVGTISGFRAPGDTHTLLWPDGDYFSWAAINIPPLPTVMAHFEKEMPVWEDRGTTIFWTGAFSGGRGVRESYAACAKAHSHAMHFDQVDWSQMKHGPNHMKSMAMDFRHLLQHRFNAYIWGNSWSSSMKRILISGGVVLMPNPNLHETMETMMLKECENCVLYYDSRPDKLCESMLNEVAQISDRRASTMAARLQNFSFTKFRLESVHEFMMDVLRQKNPTGNDPWTVVSQAPDKIVVNRRWNGGPLADKELIHVDCMGAKQLYGNSLLDARLVDAWFDNECKINYDDDLDFEAI